MSRASASTPEPAQAPEPPAEADAEVAQLVAHAEHLGLGAIDLDEFVHEAADEDAAASYNAGERADLDDVAAHEQLHDLAGHAAADVNNGGLEAQVRYLHVRYGASGVRELLDRAALA